MPWARHDTRGGQFPDGDRPDAGLQPDILVVPTVKDIATGRDPEPEAVRAAVALVASLLLRRGSTPSLGRAWRSQIKPHIPLVMILCFGLRGYGSKKEISPSEDVLRMGSRTTHDTMNVPPGAVLLHNAIRPMNPSEMSHQITAQAQPPTSRNILQL